MIRSGPRFEVLATNSVDEPVMASPAIVDGILYLRGAEHLYAIAEPAASAVTSPDSPTASPRELCSGCPRISTNNRGGRVTATSTSEGTH